MTPPMRAMLASCWPSEREGEVADVIPMAGQASFHFGGLQIPNLNSFDFALAGPLLATEAAPYGGKFGRMRLRGLRAARLGITMSQL